MLMTLRCEPTFKLVCQTANPLNCPLQACRPAHGVLAGLLRGFLAGLDGLGSLSPLRTAAFIRQSS